MPSGALVLGAIASVQLGAAVATTLFGRIGPGGTVFERLGFGSLILLAVWALGCMAVLAVWMARWAKVRSAVRAGALLALPAPMPVLASPWMREPGLVGLWRPVLVVPESLFYHLSRAETLARRHRRASVPADATGSSADATGSSAGRVWLTCSHTA